MSTEESSIRAATLSGRFRVLENPGMRLWLITFHLGCTAAFDYHTPTCASDILAATKGELKFVLDCITTTDSMKLCYEAIGSAGGRYISLDPFPLRSHTRRSKWHKQACKTSSPDAR